MSDDEISPLLSERQRNLNENYNGISPIISETDNAITVRRPVHYYSVNNGPQNSDHQERTSATINRYKYYSRLSTGNNTALLMPNHVVPPEYFLVIPIKPEVGTQSSIVTIFSIWNTMMGTSILSIPWAIKEAGFACGVSIILLMGAITLYTAYRVMKSPQQTGNFLAMQEFTDVCRDYLGKWGFYISVFFSLITLLGAAIVYWVLMSNFLFSSVRFVYDESRHEFNNTQAINSTQIDDVLCLHPRHYNNSAVRLWKGSVQNEESLFQSHNNATHQRFIEMIWNETYTVPFILILILGPLVNFKSPTFFTKFNALGTISILYIVTFISIKAEKWGINVNFNDAMDIQYVQQFSWTFPALSGTLSLALFIHNCILSIVRNQKKPENNGRDLSIAYFLVVCTYVFVGVVYYVCFPLPKYCIEDNLLNNFTRKDIPSFVARIFLFFQMVTVFPMLMYVLRIQFMDAAFGSYYPSLKHVLLLNAVVISVCVTFAVLLPKIGLIIRFSGALCGLAYIFTLPCVIYLLSLKRRGMLTLPVTLFHSTIIVLGVANFVAQFIIIK